MGITGFGTKVLGKKKFKKEQAAKIETIREGAEALGPRVLGEHPRGKRPKAPAKKKPVLAPDVVPTDKSVNDEPGERHPGFDAFQRAQAEAEKAPSSMSINKLEEFLAEEPESFDRLLSEEFSRPGGPRKGALRAFLSTENSQAEPRAGIIKLIDEAL